MPTLFRLLTTLFLLAGAVFAVMAALVFLVEPTPREVVIELPLEQLRPPPPPGQPIRAPRS
ncbi:MAG: histidine kinase [Rhizobiaceae bacterium]|nr:histidine kinase [Rhizobiaceae bacterium]